MKTKESIQNEISALQSKGANKSLFTPSEYKALGRRVEFLRTVLNYLQSEPRMEFIEKQKADLENKLKLIDDGFKKFIDFRPKDNKDTKQVISEYESQMGVKHIKSQLKTLNYILN